MGCVCSINSLFLKSNRIAHLYIHVWYNCCIQCKSYFFLFFFFWFLSLIIAPKIIMIISSRKSWNKTGKKTRKRTKSISKIIYMHRLWSWIRTRSEWEGNNDDRVWSKFESGSLILIFYNCRRITTERREHDWTYKKKRSQLDQSFNVVT